MSAPLSATVSSALCVVNERVIVPYDAVPLGKHQLEGDRRLKNVCTKFTMNLPTDLKKWGHTPRSRELLPLQAAFVGRIGVDFRNSIHRQTRRPRL
jgi:hypothetical protein